MCVCSDETSGNLSLGKVWVSMVMHVCSGCIKNIHVHVHVSYLARGMNIALGLNNKQLFKECATILEGLKVKIRVCVSVCVS